jgi:hypothetical protein
MSKFVRGLVLVLLCAVPLVRADVTLRYKSDVQLASFLPPEMLDQFNKALKSGMAAGSQTIRMKGAKAVSATGNFSMITDFDTQELTIVDGENKRMGTIPAAKFNENWTGTMPEMPAEARKVFESMKFNFDSHRTGRTETIQGVQAEEAETTLSIEMAMPGTEQIIPTMKLVLRIWTAKPEEALRAQAIRELTAYNLWTNHVMNPTQGMTKIFGNIPAFGDGMNKMFTELGKNKTVMLRTEMKLYSSMFAQMAQRMRKQGDALPAGYDPDAALIQVTQEAEEGYQATPIAELMQALTKPKMLPKD